MTTPATTRSTDELLSCVLTKLAQNPDSRELKTSHATLYQGKRMEAKLYALPILGGCAVLFGVYLGITSGDVEVFGIFSVLGLIVALAFFPARFVYRWELKNKLRKIEEILLDYPDPSA